MALYVERVLNFSAAGHSTPAYITSTEIVDVLIARHRQMLHCTHRLRNYGTLAWRKIVMKRIKLPLYLFQDLL